MSRLPHMDGARGAFYEDLREKIGDTVERAFD
jgi:hypothetical protein